LELSTGLKLKRFPGKNDFENPFVPELRKYAQINDPPYKINAPAPIGTKSNGGQNLPFLDHILPRIRKQFRKPAEQ